MKLGTYIMPGQSTECAILRIMGKEAQIQILGNFSQVQLNATKLSDLT